MTCALRHRWMRCVAAFVIVALGRQSSATLDFDHNGVVNILDYTAFINAYAALNPLADLNGDGVFDSTDISLFTSSTNASDYRYYWATGNPCQAGVDEQTNIGPYHIRRSAIGVGDWAFTDENGYRIYNYDSGYHLMLRDSGYNTSPYAFSNWQDNYNDRMASFEAAIATALANDLPCSDPADFEGIAYLDFESAYPSWKATNQWASGQAASWRTTVAAINLTSWDTAFIALFSYTPPSGATKYGDLTSGQKDKFDEVSWTYFAMDYWTRAIAAVRATCPLARVGCYGYPTIAPIEIVFGTSGGTVPAINDELGWLYGSVDILMPEMYAPFVVNDASLSCQTCQGTTCSNPNQSYMVAWLRDGMGEVQRVRTAYASSTTILPFIWWYYAGIVGACSGDNGGPVISDTNLRMMLYQPWVYGADGAIIWGYFNPCKDHCEAIDKCPGSRCTVSGSIDTPSGLETELANRWGLVNVLGIPWP